MKKNRKSSKKRSQKIKKNAKRIAAYSAAAAATVATVGSSANAANITHDIPDVSIGGDGNTGVFFNIVTGDVSPAPSTYPNFLSYSTEGLFRAGAYYWASSPGIYGPASDTGAAFVGPGGFVSSYFYPNALDASYNIGGRKPWGAATAYVGSYGNYGLVNNSAGLHAVGLRFSVGSDTHYGWAAFDGLGAGMKLVAFGYNDLAGAISHVPVNTPEPSSMALLGLGAAGLGAWRRRRAAA